VSRLLPDDESERTTYRLPDEPPAPFPRQPAAPSWHLPAEKRRANLEHLREARKVLEQLRAKAS
jgi:hypothetical protein